MRKKVVLFLRENMATNSSRARPLNLDPMRFGRHSVIGCTYLPSRMDPELKQGVGLTTVNAYDDKLYVISFDFYKQNIYIL